MRKEPWQDRLELWLFRITVAFFAVYQLIPREFIPMDVEVLNRAALGVFAVALFAGIDLVVRRIREVKNRGGFVFASSFEKAAAMLFEHTRTIDELCILAYTSVGWRGELEKLDGSVIKIRSLKILLLHDDKFAALMPESEMFSLKAIVATWSAMMLDSARADTFSKQVERIEIRALPMVTPYYFAIADGEIGVFGYLQPRNYGGGLMTGRAAVAFSTHEPDAARLISESQDVFSNLWMWSHNGTPNWTLVFEHPTNASPSQ